MVDEVFLQGTEHRPTKGCMQPWKELELHSNSWTKA